MRTYRYRHLVLSCVAALAALAAVPAAHAGPREDTRAAELAIRSGDVVSAMGTLRRLADQGYAPAQARLADMLWAAEFYDEALTLYKRAAEQGEGAGEFGLGRMHADGTGVKRDPALALDYYRKAAAKNNWQAFDALARAHRTGDLGLTKDLAEAQAMDKKAQAAREVVEKDLQQ